MMEDISGYNQGSFISESKTSLNTLGITKCSNNYWNHIKFILWVHDLEITHQKSIKIDFVVDFLRNVNISWTTKFNS